MLKLIIARDVLNWIDANKGEDSRPTFIIKTLRNAMNEGMDDRKATNKTAD
ncbi:hypothetical protein JBO41_03235 [Enterobacter asburiae]|uniref:hypothetical protein n=1 Tax=Enterobacteriaceae TaxID=543 RepID=UPI00192B0423|nr:MULTISPECIES: hypothetical protein [Enterobacteriaceae]MBL5911036.1 hypothetical protein [Enterobacter asburiae]MBL5915667.1 hypothetical protein [Enterobacter asburiae]MCS0562691.1 hypothetical protein [Citrobacter freundii]MDH1544267.1 hypothetical protein [Enterobacter ludwigii]